MHSKEPSISQFESLLLNPKVISELARSLPRGNIAGCMQLSSVCHNLFAPFLWHSFDDSLTLWDTEICRKHSLGRDQAWIDQVFARHGRHIRKAVLHWPMTLQACAKHCSRLESVKMYPGSRITLQEASEIQERMIKKRRAKDEAQWNEFEEHKRIKWQEDCSVARRAYISRFDDVTLEGTFMTLLENSEQEWDQQEQESDQEEYVFVEQYPTASAIHESDDEWEMEEERDHSGMPSSLLPPRPPPSQRSRSPPPPTLMRRPFRGTAISESELDNCVQVLKNNPDLQKVVFLKSDQIPFVLRATLWAAITKMTQLKELSMAVFLGVDPNQLYEALSSSCNKLTMVVSSVNGSDGDDSLHGPDWHSSKVLQGQLGWQPKSILGNMALLSLKVSPILSIKTLNLRNLWLSPAQVASLLAQCPMTEFLSMASPMLFWSTEPTPQLPPFSNRPLSSWPILERVSQTLVKNLILYGPEISTFQYSAILKVLPNLESFEILPDLQTYTSSTCNDKPNYIPSLLSCRFDFASIIQNLNLLPQVSLTRLTLNIAGIHPYELISMLSQCSRLEELVLRAPVYNRGIYPNSLASTPRTRLLYGPHVVVGSPPESLPFKFESLKHFCYLFGSDSCADPFLIKMFRVMPNLRCLSISKLDYWEARYLTAHCGTSLEELNMEEAPHRSEYYPWSTRGARCDCTLGIDHVMATCPNLRIIKARGHTLFSGDLLTKTHPWVCKKLELLRVQFSGLGGLDPVRQAVLDNIPEDSIRQRSLTYEEQICRNFFKLRIDRMGRVYDLLANLTGLKELEIGGYAGVFSIEWTMQAGLGKLEGLKEMQVLRFVQVSHRATTVEQEWMATHWPLLRKVMLKWNS